MLATPQTQSLQFLGGSKVGGAGVVAFRVVVVLIEGASVVLVLKASPTVVSVGDVGELLSVANVAVSGEAPGRCGNNESTHCTNVFWDCLSSGDVGVVPTKEDS